VFIIGGFDHEDIVGLPPSTLTACEAYLPPEDNATPAHVESIMHLNVPRAYAGCCHMNGLIYVFGGLNGYETLSSIEMYNTGSDSKGILNGAGPNTWTLLYTKMPLKLAKLAAAPIDKTSIMIVGGIYGSSTDEGYQDMSYQYVSSSYKLELSTN
jgi:N-acetylneuraminic acid mutarotase